MKTKELIEKLNELQNGIYPVDDEIIEEITKRLEELEELRKAIKEITFACHRLWSD